MALPYPHLFVLIILGGTFLAVGLGIFLWARRAEGRYYDGLASRSDMREFVDRSEDRPGYRSVRLGGLICMIIGAVVLGIAGGLRLG